jgi:hypothetical protein
MFLFFLSLFSFFFSFSFFLSFLRALGVGKDIVEDSIRANKLSCQASTIFHRIIDFVFTGQADDAVRNQPVGLQRRKTTSRFVVVRCRTIYFCFCFCVVSMFNSKRRNRRVCRCRPSRRRYPVTRSSVSITVRFGSRPSSYVYSVADARSPVPHRLPIAQEMKYVHCYCKP